MNTCLACGNSIPDGFGYCLDCETLLWKAQLIVEVFTTLRQTQTAGTAHLKAGYDAMLYDHAIRASQRRAHLDEDLGPRTPTQA